MIITIKNWIRPYYYKKVLDSLIKARCNTKILNIVDMSGGQFDIFQSMDKDCELDIETIRGERSGCAGNTWTAFQEGFSRDDFVVHLEDDTIVSPDFLLFMEWCYKKFKDREDIYIFSGYNFTDKIMSDDYIDKAIIRKPFKTFLAWGWQRRYWEEIDNWFGITWKGFVEPRNIPEGNDFLKLVDKSDEGSWGWPLLKYWSKGRKEVVPIISRCQNIGIKNGRFNPTVEYFKKYVETRSFNIDRRVTEWQVL